MFKKMLFAIPLVLVLALVVSVSTSVQGEVALTDAQMSSVYGGCSVHETGDTACAGPSYTGDCEQVETPWPGGAGGCEGTWQTTCKQSEKYCVEVSDHGCIDDADIDCANTWDACYCYEYLSQCFKSCTYDLLCSGKTPGTKSDAHDRW